MPLMFILTQSFYLIFLVASDCVTMQSYPPIPKVSQYSSNPTGLSIKVASRGGNSVISIGSNHTIYIKNICKPFAANTIHDDDGQKNISDYELPFLRHKLKLASDVSTKVVESIPEIGQELVVEEVMANAKELLLTPKVAEVMADATELPLIAKVAKVPPAEEEIPLTPASVVLSTESGSQEFFSAESTITSADESQYDDAQSNILTDTTSNIFDNADNALSIIEALREKIKDKIVVQFKLLQDPKFQAIKEKREKLHANIAKKIEKQNKKQESLKKIKHHASLKKQIAVRAKEIQEMQDLQKEIKRTINDFCFIEKSLQRILNHLLYGHKMGEKGLKNLQERVDLLGQKLKELLNNKLNRNQRHKLLKKIDETLRIK